MRGDQLARQWRVIRALEASPNELTAAEIAWPDGRLEPARKRSPSKVLSPAKDEPAPHRDADPLIGFL